MIIEHGKIEKDVYLDYDLTLHGMITGEVIVGKKSTFILHGTCCKNLVIEQGSSVYLHGTVSGNVTNSGGILEVYGKVNGYVHTFEDGNTLIDSKAIVANGLRN